MKRVLLLFVIFFLNLYSFAQKDSISLKKQSEWITVRNNTGLIGFINSKGKEIVPCKYIAVEPFGPYRENWAKVVNAQGLIGFINSDGKEIVKPKYTRIDFFGEYKKDWAKVENSQGLIGFINSDGKEIVKPKYTRADTYTNRMEYTNTTN